MGNQHTKKQTPPEIAGSSEFPLGAKFSTPDGTVEVVSANPEYVYKRGGHAVLFRVVRVGGKRRGSAKVSVLLDSEHSSSKWNRQKSTAEKRISIDGSPPDKFMTENIGIG